MPPQADTAVAVLVDGLRALGVEIEFADLGGDAAGRLRKVKGRYLLSIDMVTDHEWACRILRETLAALAFGPEAATNARPARPRLRLVS